MKTIVVGAGGGGIASALLAAKRGEKVTLIEAHQQLGGCASYFSRGPFHFDVGATTVSGLDKDQPLQELFDLIGSYPSLDLVDPGIVFHLSNGLQLKYDLAPGQWVKQLSQHFPGDHEGFWKEVRSTADRGWQLLKSMHGPRDVGMFLRHPSYLTLVPKLLVSTDLKLRQYGLTDPYLRELIDGILLISAQATSERIPFLIGAMGLDYPAKTFRPKGGMKGLMDFFQRSLRDSGVKLVLGHKINSLDDELLRGADRVIMNVTPWNLKELAPEMNSERKFSWGAFTVYFACESAEKNPYHQVHLAHAELANYFASFSTDELSAPAGWQTVTISTHVTPEEWFGLPAEDYRRKKKKLESIIMEDFKIRFGVKSLKLLSSGTPKTFERYTHRKSGRVGGLPFLYGSNPLLMRSFKTSRKELYQVGDCSFPGQGLAGVTAGALKLHEFLKRN